MAVTVEFQRIRISEFVTPVSQYVWEVLDELLTAAEGFLKLVKNEFYGSLRAALYQMGDRWATSSSMSGK